MHTSPYPIDHVAIAVPSIADAMPLYERLTGSVGTEPQLVASQNVKVAFVGTGSARLELIEPVTPDSGVARFLAKRGPGLHHVAWRVPDIRAALAELKSAGVRLIDEAPRPGADHLVAFLHPSSFGGVLVELVEAPGTR